MERIKQFADPEEGRRFAQSFIALTSGDLRGWPSHEDHKNKKFSSGLPLQLWFIPGPRSGEVSPAIVVGEVDQLVEQSRSEKGVLVRLHSGCIYSHHLDITKIEPNTSSGTRVGLGKPPESHTCDCAEQSATAQKLIEEEGGVYVSIPRHEGRGAGLDFKRLAVRAEEEHHLTTAEAYALLGQEFDQRTYKPEIGFLKMLGFQAINLLTNNPAKIRAVEAEGLTVIRHELIQPNKAWNDYLAVKRDIAGHMFPSNQELDKLAG